MARKAPKLAQDARNAIEKWREYFKYNIDQYHMMHTFVLGQQWTDDEEEMLKTFRKVPLVSNKLAAMANTLLGEQQQNTPQLQVVPMENCDEETAHLRELITKDILFSDSATIAYQVAASQACIGGYSAFFWDTEYAHEKSFDLDFVCRYFKDPTRTYFDISAERINKTDGSRCGYIARMTRKKFREVYGDALEEKIANFTSTTQSKEEIALAVQPNEGDDPFSWADDESITIVHDFVRKYEKKVLYKLSNGRILDQDEMDELVEKSKEINNSRRFAEIEESVLGMSNATIVSPMQDQNSMGAMQNELPQGEDNQIESPQSENGEPEEHSDIMTLWYEDEPVRIEEKREVKSHKIIHYQIAGDYVLDQTDFPSDQLPIVFMDQNSYYDKNGKQICRSFFGDAKDTQRYINYLRTQSAYILKISRYDQFIGSKKNVQGNDTQRDWRDPSNVKGLLAYDESPNGHKPEQLRPPELSQSLLSQYQLAVEDLYTSTGLYPSRMGQTGNEISGAAIDARTRQGSYSTYVFFNSVNRAIATGGEIVNEMIPRVYDAERIISLMTPDEGLKNVTINKQADDYNTRIENDIRKGTYQVRLLPGPSYEGQKQQALQSLQMVLQANPQMFNLVADLYADNLPLTNNIEIKNRLKTQVPPDIIEAGKTGKMPPPNQQPNPEQQALQLQAQSQQQQIMLKAKEMQLKEQELEIKKQQILMDAQYKLQELESQRLETAAAIKEQELRYMAETERTQVDSAVAHADNLVKILTHKIA